MRFFRFCRLIVRIGLKILYRVRVSGLDTVPDGAAIFCGNHTSLGDPIFIAAYLDTSRRLRFMSKKSLFSVWGLGWLIKKLGAFPVDRGTADLTAIKTSLTLLKNGERLVLFPEGTRLHNDDAAARGGAAMLAIKSGAPVVPVYLSRGRRLFCRITLIYGRPFHPDPGEGKPNGETFAAIAQEILDRVRELGGERHAK